LAVVLPNDLDVMTVRGALLALVGSIVSLLSDRLDVTHVALILPRWIAPWQWSSRVFAAYSGV
jgi:drug/metabolite transporter superfamily protein YnfA